ncbi:MAG: WbqC family protein [Bacteroidales bacterium]|nr:WbqC family protein [Bacteroidales bacterium]
MKKTVVIHQPDFMPYLGFFHRLLNADLFVILDDVQFLRRGWHHRDKLKTSQGDSWFTLGLVKSFQDTKINSILLNDENWKEKHLNLFKQNYKKAKYTYSINR